jgi:hypothetical protein
MYRAQRLTFMRFRLLITVVLVTLWSSVAVRAAGDVTGTLTINGKTFPALHLHALLHDNAEGTLPSPTQMRVLVTDRAVPVESLYGLMFLPVADMGRRGEVEGILLQFDPAKPAEVDYTILTLKGLQTVTKRISITEFKVAGGRASGSFNFTEDSFKSFPDYPQTSFSLRIDAPVKRPPAITEDLKGADAVNSPQVKVVRAIADALATGNFDAMHKLSSYYAAVRNKEDIARLGAKAKTTFKSVGTDLKRLIPGVKRVVVRGNSAVVILPETGTFNLVFEGGSWKGG